MFSIKYYNPESNKIEVERSAALADLSRKKENLNQKGIKVSLIKI